MRATWRQPARTLAPAPSRAESRPFWSQPRNQYTGLLFGLLVLYLATASYTSQNIDLLSTFYPAWQLAHHGNVTMDAFADQHLWFVHADGRVVSNRFPGAIWLATPFYLLDSLDRPTPAMANLAAAGAAAGAMTVLFALLRRVVSARTAVLWVLLVALGTPVWTVSADGIWTHGPGQLALTIGLLLVAAGRPGLAGVLFGVAVTIRPHYAVVPAVIGCLDVLWARRLGVAAQLAVGSLCGLAAVVVYDLTVFGRMIPRGYVYESVHLDPGGLVDYLVRLSGTLVSPSRGILVCTPFLLVLLPGLRKAWAVAPPWARAGAVAGLAYMLVQLSLNRFTGGNRFFSYRLAIEWLTLSAPLLACAYEQWVLPRRWARRAFFVLAVFSVGTHAVGALLFHDTSRVIAPWSTWDPGAQFAAQPAWTAVILLVAACAAILAPRRLFLSGAEGSPPRDC